jgi:hypothetical protein
VIDVLVLGTGSLARQFAYALALQAERPLKVWIASRNMAAAVEVAHLCGMRSDIVGPRSVFQGHFFPWTDLSEAADTLYKAQPRIILHASSLQSPWTLDPGASVWGRCVQNSGFGVTLPLQAALLIYLLQALQKSTITSVVVNACYPDWVNAAVKWCEYPVFCGIGNVCILESAVRMARNAKRGSDLSLIAHHSHLAALQSSDHPSILPSIWEEEKPIDAASISWRPLREIYGSELNILTGALAAKLILKMLSGESFVANVPGPMGLPGGYPVSICGSALSLHLPKEVSLTDAVQRNDDAGFADGVRVHQDGRVEFSEVAHQVLSRLSRDFPRTISSKDLLDLSDELLKLRARIEGSPEPLSNLSIDRFRTRS